jgi:hypothetical protein
MRHKDAAPAARFALLLHGKIGRLNRTASEVVKEKVGASHELITLCSRSHLHFIVAANSGSAGGVDVTGFRTTDQQQIDRLTPCPPRACTARCSCTLGTLTARPSSMRATAHTCGRANTSLWSNATTDVGNKLAPDFGQRALRRLAFKTSLANSLPKRRATANQPLDLLRWPAYRPCFRLVVGNNGRSQSLSVGRAALLMRAHERRRGRPYTLALALRADVALGSPFALASMDPGHVWLPAMCGSVIKRQSWQGPSSAPAPPQGDSGGSGRWGNPRGKGWPTGRPATASGARARRLKSCRFHNR